MIRMPSATLPGYTLNEQRVADVRYVEDLDPPACPACRDSAGCSLVVVGWRMHMRPDGPFVEVGADPHQIVLHLTETTRSTAELSHRNGYLLR